MADIVHGVKDSVVNSTDEVHTAGIGTSLLATVGPISVTVRTHVVLVAIGITIEIKESNIALSGVARDGATSVLNGIIIVPVEDGDGAGLLLNKAAVGTRIIQTKSASAESAGKSTAVNALISAAAGNSSDVRTARGVLLAVTNPDIPVLGGGGSKCISLATVTRIPIGIDVTGSAAHDALTVMGSIPNTVAAETEVEEGVGLSPTNQMATFVLRIVGIVLERFLDVIRSAETGAVEESVAIEVE
jgi:hypothetical protein